MSECPLRVGDCCALAIWGIKPQRVKGLGSFHDTLSGEWVVLDLGTMDESRKAVQYLGKDCGGDD